MLKTGQTLYAKKLLEAINVELHRPIQRDQTTVGNRHNHITLVDNLIEMIAFTNESETA